MNRILLGLLVILFIVIFLRSNDGEPTQEEIQTLDYVDKTKSIKDFPYPQISHQFKKLSKGELPHPLNNLRDILPQNSNNLDIIRSSRDQSTLGKDRIYIPDYYRKDRLPQNDIGSEEMRPFVSDNSESESAWTDQNVSEHPKFYTSDIQNDFTNIGLFFDKNNQYNDKTSSNTDVLASDECYTDKKGTKFCMDNTRLQNIPPQLITDPESCYALNDIGLYKDRNKSKFNEHKVFNGGSFFNGVMASENENERFDKPIEMQSGSCQI